MRDQAVRDQYEEFPYPARDPADEATRLITGSPSHILEIEHFVLAGGRAGGRAGNFRALVAGGGTGDGAIMLAQQLSDRGTGSVTYLDMSAASLAIAKARAAARGLTNITFHRGSLLDLPAMLKAKDWAPFDYIDCCGVLHHLADPGNGLAALLAVLAPGGGLGLMLYGELGRTGVYPAQRAIARLSGGGPADERLALARTVVDAMPDGNWLKRNDHLADHLAGDDAGFHDLLLHSRDRAYLVGEVVELLAGAGLDITGFLPVGAYDPKHFLNDPTLIERAAALAPTERWALAEELSGALKTHVFYAVRAGDDQRGAARGFTPEMVPALREMAADRLADSLSLSPRLTATLGGVERQFEVPTGTAEIVALIDGRRNLRQIHGRLRAKGAKLSWLEFQAEFSTLYDVLHQLNILLFAGATSKKQC
ncbi:MAG: class I SAM-dependent methyltransferase [Rhodospirillaceae bacterium]|nr:class I SAM-dependent methyltransferase [Rhodospirillaceae bacterium]MBT6426290.1 class I SAM-dependent methyltransferase [Rhodospirillaceae bacterium]